MISDHWSAPKDCGEQKRTECPVLVCIQTEYTVIRHVIHNCLFAYNLLYKGPSPWTSRPARVVRNMRRRKRRRKRLKLKAFGQSTSTVGEENVNRYRFEFGDVQTKFLCDIETGSIEQVSLAVLVKRIRFRGETPLWSHLTLRCLNPLHKILCTCRKFANL